MPAPPKVLMLDDDQAFLDLYREMFTRHLPSVPEVKTALSASRALEMLQAETFSLFLVDINLPQMDGLQVLSVARRKYPELHLVALTGMRDERYRASAYASGADQFWVKPENEGEIAFFMDSIESLLQGAMSQGFRGIQRKGLVDIIQLECLTRNSTLLKVSNGTREGRIWIHLGEVVDAETQECGGEVAFQQILGWKSGHFELQAGEPSRPQTIFTSYQGLLLNTAQAMDEASSSSVAPTENAPEPQVGIDVTSLSPALSETTRFRGVEFVLVAHTTGKEQRESWGVKNSKEVAAWTRRTWDNFRRLGDRINAGDLQQITGSGGPRQVVLTSAGATRVFVGFNNSVANEQIGHTLKCIGSRFHSI